MDTGEQLQFSNLMFLTSEINSFSTGEFFTNRKAEFGWIEEAGKRFLKAVTDNKEKEVMALAKKDSPFIRIKWGLTEDTYLQIYLRMHQVNVSIAIVQHLIDCGVDVNKKNFYGETALHIAARCNNVLSVEYVNIVRVLIKNGAIIHIGNHDLLTPVHMSLLSGSRVITECLLENELPKGFEFDTNNGCWHLIKYLLQRRMYVSDFRTRYSFLLHFLAYQKDEATFEHVLNNSEFDVNAVNYKGFTLLQVVVQQGTPNMIRALINKGADPNIDFNGVENPLTATLMNNRMDNFHCLLDCGALLNNILVNGLVTYSLLHCAIYKQNFEFVKELVKLGADVNLHKYQPSPLLIACGCSFFRPSSTLSDNIVNFLFTLPKLNHCDVKIVEFLIDHGANIEAKDTSTNRTPLDQACISGNVEIAKLLLSRGSQINYGDVSTLHEAVNGKNPAIVKLLLEHNANVNFRDSKGFVPLHCALQNYTLLNGTDTTEDSFNNSKSVLIVLIAFIATMLIKKEYVLEDNFMLLMNKFVDPIYQDCVKEIRLMNMNICESRNFSFFNIFFKDIQYVGSALKNKSILKVLTDGEYKVNFPIYAEYLDKRVQKAMIRQSLFDSAIVLFHDRVNTTIPFDLLFDIFSYLSQEDFKNIEKACFVNGKSSFKV